MYVSIEFIPAAEIPDWDLEIDGATWKRIVQNELVDIREIVEECGISWSEVSRVTLDSPPGAFYVAI